LRRRRTPQRNETSLLVALASIVNRHAMDTASVNARLRKLYEDQWSSLASRLPPREHYSAPLLLHVDADYCAADVRLMVVGQQTNTWWGPDGWDTLQDNPTPIDFLLKMYKEFALGKARGKKYPGPFWGAVHSLAERLAAASGRQCGLIWSNLNRVDRAGSKKNPDARPTDRVEASLTTLPLLEEEIKILAPHVVVFFTGPRYDQLLDTTFPGVLHDELRRKSPYGVLTHPALPTASFRTYHPNYLQRAKLSRPTLDEITKRAIPILGDDKATS
jgi:hypothetical protein